MSPKPGFEVQLTEIETGLMAVFVKHHIFSDEHNAKILKTLAAKLDGTYIEDRKFRAS